MHAYRTLRVHTYTRTYGAPYACTQRSSPRLRENAWLFTPLFTIRSVRPVYSLTRLFIQSPALSCSSDPLIRRSVISIHSRTYACLPFPPDGVHLLVASALYATVKFETHILDNLTLIYVCATAFLITFPRHVHRVTVSLEPSRIEYFCPTGCAPTSSPAWTLKSRLRARNPAQCRGTKVAGGVFTVVAARVLS